jgi:hypothetical protein
MGLLSQGVPQAPKQLAILSAGHRRGMLALSQRTSWLRVTRFALVLILASTLQACGGGGGGTDATTGSGNDGTTGSGNSGAASSVLYLTTSTSSVTKAASPTDGLTDVAATLNLANATGVSFYYQPSFTGTAVTAVSIDWQAASGNNVVGAADISLYSPSLIGSGTYHDTVQVKVCTDSACQNQVAGSPVSIAVTYTVAGNAVSDATYAVTPTSLALEAPTNGSAPTATVNITAYDLPPYNAYVVFNSQTGGPVGSMSFQQLSANPEPYAYATGALTVTMKAPAALGPGVYSDVITLSICYDSRCTKLAPGSPYSIPVSYTVTASAGREFQQLIVDQSLTALSVDPTGQILYGTTTENVNTSTAAQLIQIDPASGAVTSLLTLPTSITQIVPSSDSKYLYLQTTANSIPPINPAVQVLRVRLSDMTIDQTVGLTEVTNEPSSIAVSPVDSNVWAAAIPLPLTFSPGPSFEVEIFDGQVARPNVRSVAQSIFYNQAFWSSDGSTMYILDANFDAVTVDGSGLESATLLMSGSGGTAGFDERGITAIAAGLAYNPKGQVLDINSDTVLTGQYVLPPNTNGGVATVDPTINRVFATYTQPIGNGDQEETTIESFNLSTFAPIWMTRLPVGSTPLRWGSNGLAFISGPQVYIISGAFVTH